MSLTGILLGLLIAGCAPVGPDFVKLEPQAPGQWSQALDQGLDAKPGDQTQWWLVFRDPVLNQLLETALQQNNGLEIAGLRVLEARAQLGVATGTQYPQSQFAAGNANYISPADNSGVTSGFWQYGLGASASWEIDFWGRFRRAIESADAAYLASIAAYDQAMVLLAAAVVDVYTVVRATEEQLQIARDNVIIQQRSYDIASVLYRNGADSELDMQQAETLLLATQATIPALAAGLQQARNALSTLLGQPPGTVDDLLLQSQGIPVIPADVSVGVPADLLRQRPDVRQADTRAWPCSMSTHSAPPTGPHIVY